MSLRVVFARSLQIRIEKRIFEFSIQRKRTALTRTNNTTIIKNKKRCSENLET